MCTHSISPCHHYHHVNLLLTRHHLPGKDGYQLCQEIKQDIQLSLTKSTTTDEEDVENVLSEQDKHFMEELYKLMEEELSNAELDVTRITKMLYISRTKLYYKIKGLTGETQATSSAPISLTVQLNS